MTDRPRKLDLGCGTKKAPGTIGADINVAAAPDVVHDLNHRPYPYADSSFDEILLDNVLEHLADVIATMEEIHRIGRAGATVRVLVPYFRSRWAAIDPTHVHAFTVESMAYFDENHPFFDRYRYTTARFALDRVVFNEGWEMSTFRRAIARWASRAPVRYEARVSHLVPLDELTFYLRVVK